MELRSDLGLRTAACGHGLMYDDIPWGEEEGLVGGWVGGGGEASTWRSAERDRKTNKNKTLGHHRREPSRRPLSVADRSRKRFANPLGAATPSAQSRPPPHLPERKPKPPKENERKLIAHHFVTPLGS